MGHVDPVDVVANVASGGLYGVGKGIDKAIETGKVGAGLDMAANSLGPWGSATEFVDPNVARAGNIAGAGAGIGAGIGGSSGFMGGGYGTAGAGAAPNSFAITGPLANPVPYYQGISLSDPLMGQAYPEFGSAIAGSGAGASLSGGGGTGSALTGAGLATQAAGMLGGGSPLSMPAGGAGGAPSAGPGGLTPAQLASLSAMNSQAHRGLAPTFEQRSKGSRVDPGLAGQDWSQ